MLLTIKTEEYIFIGSYSTLTTEFQFLDAGTPLEDFQLIQERIPELSTVFRITRITFIFSRMLMEPRTIR